VTHEIAWRASLILVVDPSYKFTVSEINGWLPYKLNRRTIQKKWACLDKLDTNSGGFAGV
jgi:hypothetical protein